MGAASQVGARIEWFTPTFDGAGVATVTLGATPSSIDRVFIVSRTSRRAVFVTGLVGRVVTLEGINLRTGTFAHAAGAGTLAHAAHAAGAGTLVHAGGSPDATFVRGNTAALVLQSIRRCGAAGTCGSTNCDALHPRTTAAAEEANIVQLPGGVQAMVQTALPSAHAAADVAAALATHAAHAAADVAAALADHASNTLPTVNGPEQFAIGIAYEVA